MLILWLIFIFFLNYFFEAARLAKLYCHLAGTSIVSPLTGELDALDGRGKNLKLLIQIILKFSHESKCKLLIPNMNLYVKI